MSAGDRVIQESVEGNVMAEIERLKREVAMLRAAVLNLGSLDSATDDIGVVTKGMFEASDDEGRVRLVMSAINLLEEYGIAAHFVGFDVDGKPTFYLSADDGSAMAADGNLLINRAAMTLAKYYGITWREGDVSANIDSDGESMGLEVVEPGSSELITDEGFEDDDGSWSESGTGGSFSDERARTGSYCYKLDADAGGGYISQSPAGGGFVSGNWYMARFWFSGDKPDAELSVLGPVGARSIVSVGASDGEWIEMYIIYQAIVGLQALKISAPASGVSYIDDVSYTDVTDSYRTIMLEIGKGTNAAGLNLQNTELQAWRNITSRMDYYHWLRNTYVPGTVSAVVRRNSPALVWPSRKQWFAVQPGVSNAPYDLLTASTQQGTAQTTVAIGSRNYLKKSATSTNYAGLYNTNGYVQLDQEPVFEAWYHLDADTRRAVWIGLTGSLLTSPTATAVHAVAYIAATDVAPGQAWELNVGDGATNYRQAIDVYAADDTEYHIRIRSTVNLSPSGYIFLSVNDSPEVSIGPFNPAGAFFTTPMGWIHRQLSVVATRVWGFGGLACEWPCNG